VNQKDKKAWNPSFPYLNRQLRGCFWVWTKKRRRSWGSLVSWKQEQWGKDILL